VRLERDGSQAVRPTALTDSALAIWGTPGPERGYLAYSTGYRSVRRWMGLADHRHRIRVELWTRSASTSVTR